MPPNPHSNAHGFAMRSMSLSEMQIPKSEKKILGPPLPNPGDAPEISYLEETSKTLRSMQWCIRNRQKHEGKYAYYAILL